MSNGHVVPYISALEVQPESEGLHFETPPAHTKHHSFPWKDAQQIDRATEFYVNEPARTASIVAPDHFVEADGGTALEKSSRTDFTQLTRNAAGTMVQGVNSMLTVTFQVVVAGTGSKLTASYKPPFSKLTVKTYAATPEAANAMIAFAKSLEIPLKEGELDMRDLEYMDRDEELYDDEFDLEIDDEEFETDEDDRELLSEYEAGPSDDDDDTDDEAMDRFAQRLHEISQREFESEFELDNALDGALRGVEDEYFVRRVVRRRKRGKGRKVFGNILRAGTKLVGKIASKLPVSSLVKAGTSLVRGDLRGTLKNLGKAAVGTVGTALLGPAGGALATSAVDALGGGEENAAEDEVPRRRRRRMAIRRLARVARDSYKELADNLPDGVHDPYIAHEAAQKVVRRAMIRHGMGRRRPETDAGRAEADAQPGLRRVVRLRPGETLIIRG
jgi:hypothetical protein